MNKNGDLRSAVYGRYLDAQGNQNAYAPLALSDDVGNELYGRHFEGVDREGPVIELGAGAGHFLAYLRRKGFTHVRGVDLSGPLVDLAKENGVEVVQGDALGFLAGIGDASCAAVVAIDVFEHLGREDLLAIARECHRVLKAHGRLLVQTVNGQGLFPGQVMFGDLTHVTILNPASMSQLLAMCGFSEISFHETGPLGSSTRDCIRKLVWRAIKRALNFCRWVEARKRQDVWTENMICCCRKPGKQAG